MYPASKSHVTIITSLNKNVLPLFCYDSALFLPLFHQKRTLKTGKRKQITHRGFELVEHPKVISERLGHSSIEMTMNTYSHVIPDMQ
jgi:integrase